MVYAASGAVGDAGNFTSLKFLASNLDDIAPLSGAGSRVPEPDTMLLLPLGLAGLLLGRARRNKQV